MAKYYYLKYPITEESSEWYDYSMRSYSSDNYLPFEARTSANTPNNIYSQYRSLLTKKPNQYYWWEGAGITTSPGSELSSAITGYADYTGNPWIYTYPSHNVVRAEITLELRYYNITTDRRIRYQVLGTTTNARTYRQALYSETIEAENGTYPNDGVMGQYWYIRDRPVNSTPTISGSDSSLGVKNTDFTFTYSVNDTDTSDSLTVVEKIGTTVIRTTTNATRNANYIFNVTNVKGLAKGTHTLTITVTDNSGASSVRTHTFVKDNNIPTITGTNTNYGNLTAKPAAFSYTVTDADSDILTIIEKVDGKIIRSFTANSGTSHSLQLSDEQWLQTKLNTTINLTIDISDGKGGTAKITHTFVRKETKINFQLKTPFKTNELAKRILLNLSGNIPSNVSVLIEASNNALDSTPTWEDITPLSLRGLPYPFKNKTKTNTYGAVSYKIKVDRGTSTEDIYLNGVGGAYD